MRIFPIALIVIGSLGVAKYLGLVPAGMGPLVGPLLLIALGMALLFRRRRSCRDGWSGRGGRGSAAAPQSPSGGLV